jgi:hypothetical protein
MEKIARVSGLNFFSFSFPLHMKGKKLEDKKNLIEDLSSYKQNRPLVKLYSFYDDQGIYFHFDLDFPFQESNETDYRKGDSIEIFLDTRDNKKAVSMTKFCHHFIFFPDTRVGKEITNFRLEDRHDFCDPKAFTCKSSFDSKSYSFEISIPSYCMHGYDPNEFDRLGFCYRVNRKGEDPLYLNVLSEEFAIEKSPSLWASFDFVKEK